jgi:acetyl/propionyl-CoA carboxylase alpha subunit
MPFMTGGSSGPHVLFRRRVPPISARSDGQGTITLEAMKIQTNINAERDGKIGQGPREAGNRCRNR